MSARNLVVISYYDQRSVETLLALLDQTLSIDAGAAFDLCVVVNSDGVNLAPLPERHKAVQVLHRENLGYNVGAWQHGWKTNPSYDFYLFLQDECVIRLPGWLAAIAETARNRNVGFVGEGVDCYESWGTFKRCWPPIAEEIHRMAAVHGIALGARPDYVQTLIVGARRDVLERTGGFVVGASKTSACAGEILTSVRARALGLRNVQVAWRPFEYIRHPQWDDIRAMSGGWRWQVSRAMHLYLPSSINRLVPRRKRGFSPNRHFSSSEN
jgi:hypothetical protein